MTEPEMGPCPLCLAEIPSAATRCRHCAGDLLRPTDAPNVGGFWASGVLLSIVGAVVIAAGSDGGGGGAVWVGVLIAVIGGVLLQIAVISSAVSIGIRDRDQMSWSIRHANAEKMTT